ncbi:gamma-glutamyltransferase family protein [Paracoccus onubensis]|uniref:gamma-glutamyltransferase family protein n=1 Tax=Paracoccus onubensis TaxID=1675788 RepID=UPI002731A6B0|nr:gamma-glutamyltransferase family protein [Paracoccus onubensis]MDP0926932.1 gamma-glutamyltransferase family protein [Paracoccus onubensis]
MVCFTTRPEIRGNFGVVTSTHWIASAVGMSILEKGGNAFDAAVATGFVLQVVEPHLNGPAGDLPILLRPSGGTPSVICAQGTAPKAASAAAMRALGIDLIPGSGLLATVVPGAFDGWMLLLRDHGRLELEDVLAPAIWYLREGHPLLPGVASTIEGLEPFFKQHWPSSAEVWIPGGKVPQPLQPFRNPALAATWERILSEATGESREARIDAARQVWRNGFVADAIGSFLKTARVMDVTGQRQSALLTRDDIASWQARMEPTVSIDYHGWSIHKTGPWGQGPVLLMALQILRNFDLAKLDPLGEEFVHTVTEAIKLAWADREAYFGDPDFFDIPLTTLLSEDYGRARAALIGEAASLEQRPGRIPGYEYLADAAIARAMRQSGIEDDPATGEPTMAHLTEMRGDTVHIDVIDRWGNIVSATPSGGWLQSSPVIPGLGFALNSRAQMFWLEDGLASSLRPGARPRTTLTPSLAFNEDGRALAFGTPGGDQQDQWQLIWFLRMVHHGYDLQAGIDAPLFHSQHFQASFFPRDAHPARLVIEESIGAGTIEGLRRRGHGVTVAEAWSVGRLTAALRHSDGTLQAAATPRLMQAYAVGR